jgi:hypothetical protein
VDENAIMVNALRMKMPPDATVGDVQYTPEALAESNVPARQVLGAATGLGAGAGVGRLVRLLADRRVNEMFQPAQKKFWELFGKRKGD